MALIKCPECGKENVSDSAKSCPVCGYGIKEHYDRINERKQQKMIYEARMNNVKEPEKPKDDLYVVIICVVSAVALLIFFIELPGLGITFFIGLLIIAAIFYSKYLTAMQQYKDDCELYKNNRKEYQRRVVQKEDFHIAMEELKPKCPQCNSTNIEKISTVDRAISVEIVGLASNKIGKQFKCKDCKYMW